MFGKKKSQARKITDPGLVEASNAARMPEEFNAASESVNQIRAKINATAKNMNTNTYFEAAVRTVGLGIWQVRIRKRIPPVGASIFGLLDPGYDYPIMTRYCLGRTNARIWATNMTRKLQRDHDRKTDYYNFVINSKKE